MNGLQTDDILSDCIPLAVQNFSRQCLGNLPTSRLSAQLRSSATPRASKTDAYQRREFYLSTVTLSQSPTHQEILYWVERCSAVVSGPIGVVDRQAEPSPDLDDRFLKVDV